jgi:replicative DNA helicase
VPSQSEELEKKCAALILKFEQVRDETRLAIRDFGTVQLYERVFTAAMQLHSSGDPVTFNTVHHEMGGNTADAQVIRDLMAESIFPHEAEKFERHLTAITAKRRFRDAVEIVMEDHRLTDPDDVIVEIDRVIETCKYSGNGTEVKAEDGAMETYANYEEAWSSGELPRFKTGYHNIDADMGGLFPGEMNVIAARPHGGKTLLMLNMALNLIKSGVRVGISTNDDKPSDFWMRLMGMAGEANVKQIRNEARPQKEERAKFKAGRDLIRGMPLWVDSVAGLDIHKVIRGARRMKRRYNIDVWFFDYIQNVARSDRRMSDVELVQEASKAVKLLGQQTGMAVVPCAQFNRQAEEGRGSMKELKGSGQIEQDANHIIQPDFYLKDLSGRIYHLKGKGSGLGPYEGWEVGYTPETQMIVNMDTPMPPPPRTF